jgi:hypothetical protein
VQIIRENQSVGKSFKKRPPPLKIKENNMPLDISELFPKETKNRSEGLCATCGNTPGDFKDEISEKEFKITGMCQACQDGLFD